MYYWFLPVGLAVGFLAWMLFKALKQFETVNAASALKKTSELENRLEMLRERVENLEKIESDSLLGQEHSIEMPESADSLSLKARPSPTRET